MDSGSTAGKVRRLALQQEILQALLPIDVFLLLICGCLIGLIFGALPGLGATIGLALILPFTFGWDPMPAIYLFVGIIGSNAFGGSIPAILLNTPGTPANAATLVGTASTTVISVSSQIDSDEEIINN